MTKAVLFDLDDTLFDHRFAARCVLQDLRESHVALQRFPLEVLEREDFRLLGEKHAFVLAGSLSIDEARKVRLQALFEFCGEHISEDEAIKLAARRQMVYRRSRQPVAGAIELLQTLRKHARIAIVTNNLTEEQRGKVAACNLHPLIDLLITSEDAGCVKPSAEIFHAALERLECSPNEAVMVGDAWEVDVIGARNAGIRAIWFNRDGIRNPDPATVPELSSFEPAEAAAHLILG
ncbi:MAG: HAD family hydrolase [Acidobacteria bacterium]|nr:HAD family hydrolase [Acidobacteriota bacterium]